MPGGTALLPLRAVVYTPFVGPSEDRDMRWLAALFLLNLDLPSRPTQVDWELEFNRHQYAPWLLAQGCDFTTEKICPLFLFVKKGHRKPWADSGVAARKNM